MKKEIILFMVDSIYKDAFKEVSVILENTDEELLSKIPNKFIEFIKNNMNTEYKTYLNPSIDLDKQKLLKETEAILSLIYRSYFATDEEKNQFMYTDEIELQKIEERKKQEYKSIDEIFNKKNDISKVMLDNSLMVIPKENFIMKIIKKIKAFFKINN